MGISDFDPQCKAAFSSAYTDWVIQQVLSLRQANNAETIAIFQLVHGGKRSLFYTTHVGLCQVIMHQYTSRVAVVKDLLSGVLSPIHISCDLRTSTFGSSLLGVVAHFDNANGIHRTAVLSLPRPLEGDGSSNIAACM